MISSGGDRNIQGITYRHQRGQWADSPVTGHIEQYVLHDVISYVDAAHRTIPSPPLVILGRSCFVAAL
jgi:hypothetical protein